MTERQTIIPRRGAAGPQQIAAAIVDKMPGKFWSAGEVGHLLMLDEHTGEISLTTNISLSTVIEANFDTPALLRAEGGAKSVTVPLSLGRQYLTDVMSQLMLCAAPAPQWASPARPLTVSQRSEVRGRVGQGESRQSVAKSMSISVDQVFALTRPQ